MDIKEIIDYIFEKTEKLIRNSLKGIGDTFGHELALGLKNAFENGIKIYGEY